MGRRFTEVARDMDERRVKRRQTFVPVPTRAEEAVRSSVPGTPLDKGHAVMDSLRERLDSLDSERSYRSYNQVRIHTQLSASLCRQVYGPDTYKFEAEIKRHNGFKSIKQEGAITMPRRQGKSQAVGMWVAAAMLTVPGFDGICFAASAVSAGKDKGMLGIVYRTLTQKFGVSKFTKNNKNTIEIDVDGDLRAFRAFPSGTDALRGVGGKVVVVEESGYVSEEQFTELIIPLLSIDDVCFVALSTLNEDPGAWFNEMIAAERVEAFVVKYVCEACESLGATQACEHNKDAVPHWTNDSRLDMIRALYGSKNKDKFAREVMGIVKPEGEGRVFSHIKIRAVLSSPTVDLLFPVKRIFVTVDPCVGTEDVNNPMSDFAAVAIAEPHTTIMGMFAMPAIETEDYRDPLMKWLADLRSHELTRDATLVVDVEMGNAMVPGDVYAMVQEKFRNLLVVNDLARKQGTVTHPRMKHDCMTLTKYILHKDEVRFWKDFKSNVDCEEIKAQWAQQMRDYKMEFVKGASVMAKNSYKLTGKGSNGDKRDDLCFTFQRAIRLRDRFENDPQLRTRLLI